ncbi:hypothetical protein GALMADRAFT_235628 [Galerina marginata CBS 339.88]|uniref:Uncharacterized protein n=1 Tax=Galerina marginata (strain CBS 339.88) TaxID=685588 RepID=A0A067TJV3_GALM3|nr:hypothetical protein GALMADRAFT_235628 [Galerina marginata CBS 339.88]
MQNILHEEKGGKSLAAVTSNGAFSPDSVNVCLTPEIVENEDEPESEMTRIQLLESNVHQPEKAAQDAQQGDTHLENKLPRFTGSHASPLDSPLPMDLSKSASTQNLASTAYPTTPNQDDNIKRDGPSAPTNHQSIDMISEPSSSAISAQNSNVNTTIEDQHQTTDIEMADIRAAH